MVAPDVAYVTIIFSLNPLYLINECYIVRLKNFKRELVHQLNDIILKRVFFSFSNFKDYVSILYIVYELLNVEHGKPISHKNV